MGLAVGHFFDSAAQAVVAIRARREGRRIPGGEVFDLRQPILRIVGVLGKVPGREECLSGEVPVVVVLIGLVRIGVELIPRVNDTRASRPVPHRIVGEALRRGEEGMAGTREAIQRVVPKALRASSVGQTRPIPDWVVGVGGLIDLRGTRHNLMQNIGDLNRGIIGYPIVGADPPRR